ncbi:MAG: HEAT repeat domain-containing protein [Nitrospirota bacterium]
MAMQVKKIKAILILLFLAVSIGSINVANASETTHKRSPLLNELLRILEKMNIPALKEVRKGLTDDEIQAALNSLPYKVSREIKVLYKWSNGSSGRPELQLIPGYRMFSLNEAIKRTNIMSKIRQENTPWYERFKITSIISTKNENSVRDDVWNENWFPLFSVWDADYLVVVGSEKEKESSPVYYVYSEGGGSYMAYDSITTMVQTVIKCYEKNAYLVNTKNSEIIEDEIAVSKITSDLNPIRTNTLLASLNVTKIEGLVDKLKDKDGFVRGRALNAIILLKDSRLVEPLLEMLQEPDPDIRNMAVKGLGELRNVVAVNSLEKLAKNDSDEVVRKNAKNAMSMIHAYKNRTIKPRTNPER